MPAEISREAERGEGAKVRLSDGQREVLGVLARHDYPIDGAPSTPEISRRLRKRFDDWARGKLVALEKRGLVERLGTTFRNGQCWSITDAGRRALSAAQKDGGQA
jgi:hypothetical protein